MTSGGRGGLRLPAGKTEWAPVDSVIPLYDGQRPQQRVALMSQRFMIRLHLPAGRSEWPPVESVIPLYDGQRPQQRVALVNKRFITERPNRSASPGRSAPPNP